VGLKEKDLVGIPWRVAFALQADGWYLRQDIIWHKPNPMPESVRDRCTKSHEYIFLLSKNPKYYYDNEAIKEDAKSAGKKSDGFKGRQGGAEYHATSGGIGSEEKIYNKKNKRSVWTITTKPYKEAHFATFPTDLIEPCVLAGCPEGGTVLDPFGGSGTTGLVASKHNRNAVLCELNEGYIDIAEKRLNDGFDIFSSDGLEII
jgi:DNA modification methylase